MKKKLIETGRLLSSVLVCQLAGIIGALATSSDSSWYLSLQKPWFTPPGWAFAPVWTTLYLLMGIALYWIWKKGLDRKEVKIAISLFFTQLLLNGAWSFLFFGWQNALASFIDIILLIFVLILTTLKFYDIDKKAGLILTPYIAWVVIATFLNYSILVLN